MAEIRHEHYFALGRNAIYAVCKILDITTEDEVLTPAWDCDGTLEPFRVIGCKPVFYRSDPYSFEVDLDHIHELITSKTKLIHIINHFGQSQPWDRISEFRKQVNIPILEDNAYSFKSAFREIEFGNLGDYSIFSLRKNLPLPDGGILKINSNVNGYKIPEKAKWLNSPEYQRTIDYSVLFLKRRFGLNRKKILKSGGGNLNPSKYYPPLYSTGSDEYPPWERGSIEADFAFGYERPMSKLARMIYSLYTPSKLRKIIENKRNFYRFLVDELKDLKEVEILHPELKDGVVPYCVNLLVKENRDEIIQNLQQKKYSVMAWPTLSLEVLTNLKNFPEVELLGRHLLQINLKPDLDFSTVKNLCEDLKKSINQKI